MMNFQSKFPVRIVWAVLLLVGCTEQGEEEVIDESYLGSESYQEFKQNSARESSYRVDEATAFERILTNFLADPQTREINLPMKVDSLTLEKYVDESAGFELKQTMLNEPADMDYTYYPVGKAEREGMRLLFFVIQKQSMYQDRELAVATFRDKSLMEVQSLGEFSKTISQQVQSTVRIDPSLNITSQIIRKTKYPVPQEFHTRYRYSISHDGKINEEVLSE